MELQQDCQTIISHGQWNHIRFARARHRDYPEVEGEGGSAAEAVAQLGRKLACALDCARDARARESILRALEDVRRIGR